MQRVGTETDVKQKDMNPAPLLVIGSYTGLHPLQVEGAFHRDSPSEDTDTYITFLNGSKIIVMMEQQNNAMVGTHHNVRTALRGYSTRKVENHCCNRNIVMEHLNH